METTDEVVEISEDVEFDLSLDGCDVELSASFICCFFLDFPIVWTRKFVIHYKSVIQCVMLTPEQTRAVTPHNPQTRTHHAEKKSIKENKRRKKKELGGDGKETMCKS